jgi:glycosyltransferase involved in cell wall biosynthesis
VGMVASFIEYKDWDTYINAALEIASQREDVCFLCIGDGDYSIFKRKIASSAKTRILFLGRQNPVESIMNICDVGVLTTNINHHGEGISNALLEFMALGKPVIATNFGGSVELIQANVSGELIEPFNADQLSVTINLWLDNDELRNTIGNNALKRVKENFNIEGMVNSFYEEYCNLSAEK